MDLLIPSAFIRPRKQTEREGSVSKRGSRRDTEGESTFIRADSILLPSDFAWDQAGVCCDSPWVTAITYFIHNATSPQLINVRIPINCSHKNTIQTLAQDITWERESTPVKFHLNPEELQISCRAIRCGRGHGYAGSKFEEISICKTQTLTNYVQYVWGCDLITVLPLAH